MTSSIGDFGLFSVLTSGNGTAAGGIPAGRSRCGDIVQFEVPAPIIDQNACTIFNVSAVWVSEDDCWSVGLEDNTTIFYGPPRTVTGTVEYRF